MREIKFRAWDIKANKMDNLRNNTWLEFCNYCSPQLVNSGAVGYERIVIEDFILMQYTGATDIYEADIIEFHLNDEYSDDNVTIPEETVHIGVIVFKWGGWLVKTLDNDYLWFERIVECSDIKVIGNIYESPELLEN